MDEDVFVQGLSLGRVARGRGPFVSAFLMVGEAGPVVPDEVALQIADLAPETVAGFEQELARGANLTDVEAMAVIAGADVSATFEFMEPIRRSVCRIGRFPSLGPVLEQRQLMVSHAMVTVEDGMFGVTTFGSRAVPDAEGRSLGVTGSIDAVVEELRFATPRLLAIAGRGADLEQVENDLGQAFPQARLASYQIDDLGTELDALADQLVRDAAAVAAEDVAHELSAFRAAAAEGLVVEGEAVMDALLRRELSTVLVHDDVDDDRERDGERLVDAVVATAVGEGLRVTMIPAVHRRRGPAGGLGGIIGPAPVPAAAQADPVEVEQRAARPIDKRPKIARPA